MAKFKTADQARQAGATFYGAGKCTAWCEHRQFGAYVLRACIGGRWLTLRVEDMA